MKAMEHADRVRAAADAGDDAHPAAPPVALEHLRARFAADDGLQLAHQVGIGMRPDRRAEQVIGVGRIGDPVAHRLIDRRAQRAIAAGDRHDRRRRAGACGRRSAPGAPCRPRPCTPCTAVRRARRRRRSRRRAVRRRSRRRCASRRGACASSACPIALLILCAPVCARSSRLSQTLRAPALREPRARRSAPSDGPTQLVAARASSSPGNPRACRCSRTPCSSRSSAGMSVSGT